MPKLRMKPYTFDGITINANSRKEARAKLPGVIARMARALQGVPPVYVIDGLLVTVTPEFFADDLQWTYSVIDPLDQRTNRTARTYGATGNDREETLRAGIRHAAQNVWSPANPDDGAWLLALPVLNSDDRASLAHWIKFQRQYIAARDACDGKLDGSILHRIACDARSVEEAAAAARAAHS